MAPNFLSNVTRLGVTPQVSNRVHGKHESSPAALESLAMDQFAASGLPAGRHDETLLSVRTPRLSDE